MAAVAVRRLNGGRKTSWRGYLAAVLRLEAPATRNPKIAFRPRLALICGVDTRPGRLLVTGVLTALMLPGCGGDGMPRAEVSGNVTFAGQPVTGGIIVFTPERGPQATSPLSPDGEYRLTTPGHGDGAVVGRHRVSITSLYDETPLAGYDENSGDPLPQLDLLLQPRLPERYFHPQKSGLTIDVAAGDQVHDFDLMP